MWTCFFWSIYSFIHFKLLALSSWNLYFACKESFILKSSDLFFPCVTPQRAFPVLQSETVWILFFCFPFLHNKLNEFSSGWHHDTPYRLSNSNFAHHLVFLQIWILFLPKVTHSGQHNSGVNCLLLKPFILKRSAPLWALEAVTFHMEIYFYHLYVRPKVWVRLILLSHTCCW